VTIWRVSNHVTLDGGGGVRASHRWHTRGRRIVYCAPNPATSLLEVLVQNEVDIQDLPRTYQFIEIDMPDSVSSENLDLNSFPSDWKSNTEVTRKMGDAWLEATQTALLLVPCVIVPETSNILMNPRHPDSSLASIRRVHQHFLDARLLKTGRAG
jgi:RES domain-containing protein